MNDAPIRVAYADPPYPGQARRHYAKDAASRGFEAKEVNHRVLIGTLCREYPDGWALSTSSPALRSVLALCPSGVRVMPWVKPFAVFKPGVNPAFAWEPVIVCGGRPRTRQQPTVRDWVSANITLRRGLTGAKPEIFAFWLFEVLNIRPGDTLDDIFPGSGAISQAWAAWCSQHELPLTVGA